MLAEHFRALRVQAGLSIRLAATTLAVAPSTIQRWESGQSPIPSEPAERLAALAHLRSEHTDPDVSLGYRLGRLYRVLEVAAGTEPETHRYRVAESPAIGLPRLIARAHAPDRATARQGVADRLIDLMGAIPAADALPAHLSNAADGAFWLGYYHERADARPNLDGPLP